MYKFTKEQVLDPEFLTKLIRRFKKEYKPRFLKDQLYYQVKTEILLRKMEEGKPNNKLAHGFCRYISNMATSYFAGKPIRYDFDNNVNGWEEYQAAVKEILRNNYMDSLHFKVSKEASKKGIGFYLMFLNEKSELRIKKMDAEEIIPVYSQSMDEFLEAAIHIYSVYDIDGKFSADYADVYDDTYIYHYMRKDKSENYTLIKGTEEGPNPEPHKLSDIPVIVVWNSEDQIGDYEPIITINDAYDRGQSDTANDMDYFSDAYLCIAGASEITEDTLTSEGDDSERSVKSLRNNKILFLDEKGQASWLTKNINDTASENYKNRLYKDIFFLSQVPALSDENFAGNLSGIAIKYKLLGLEELAGEKEIYSRAAHTKMLKIITDHLNMKRNKEWDPDTITLKYTRNFTENISDMITDARNLEGMVSRETQISMLPADVVPDVDQEIKKMQEEELQSEKLPKVNIDDL